MALSSPPLFAKFKNQRGALNAVVVKLTSASVDYYFSRIDMQIGNIHVYPLLDDFSGVRSSIDIFSKRWSVSEVTVNIHNAPYRVNNSGNWITPAVDLSSVRGQSGTIYFLAGDGADSFDDMLTVFSGVVVEPLSYDEETVTVKIVDKFSYRNITLPKVYMKTIFPTTPPEFQSQKIPLCYGKYSFNSTDFDGSGDGMAVAIPTAYGPHANVVVSDHVLNAFTEMWFAEPSNTDPTKYENPTLSVDSGGRGIGTRTFNLIGWIYPTRKYTADDNYVTTVTSYELDFYNAIDRRSTTYTVLMNNLVIGDGSTVPPEGLILFGFENDSFLEEVTGRGAQFKFDIKSNDHAGTNITSKERRLYYSSHYTVDDYFSEAHGSSSSWQTSTSWISLPPKYSVSGATNITPIVITTSVSNEIYTGDVVRIWGVLGNTSANGTWNVRRITSSTFSLSGSAGIASYTSGGYVQKIKSKDRPFLIGIWCRGSTSQGGGELSMIDIYGIRIQLRYQVQYYPSAVSWAVCEGRKYGSWINSRSSNYAAGNCIEDPSGIIESILRDEMGFVDADIDMPSFIAAENTSMKMRLNLWTKTEATSDKIIRQIAEQSTFAFIPSPSGKARLIPLNNSTPTTARIIPYSHIIENSIKISKTEYVVNYLRYRSRFQQEYDAYGDNGLEENAASQAAFGIQRYNAEWKNISGTTVSHLADHLVGNADAIWANEHVEIQLDTVGFVSSDLEVGDWIELDDDSLDPHIKVYGTSWSGLQFLITEMTLKENSTHIRAVKLY